MELPYTIVFEPPSRTELRALLRLRRTWVAAVALSLVVGAFIALTAMGRSEAAASAPLVSVDITSRPPARVSIDGQDAGSTPLVTTLASGPHIVAFKQTGAVETTYTLPADTERATWSVALWAGQPVVSRLRSTLPGAALSGARLLDDGRVALTISLPAGHQLQAWRLEPVTGAVEPLLEGVIGTRVVVSPDARQVALLGNAIGPPVRAVDPLDGEGARSEVAWIFDAGAAAPARGWRAPLSRGESLVDLTWSPRAERWLVIGTLPQGGRAAASRLWFVDPATLEWSEAAQLPSGVVPGSAVWSPDGLHVAFVAHAAGVNALCLLDVDGGFRYVADLDPSIDPPGVPPAAWSADSQQLLFVAPRQRFPGVPVTWLQPEVPPRVLYVANLAEARPTELSDTTIDSAVWREDGQIVGLGRLGSDGLLDLRLMNGPPAGQHLVQLPVKPAAAYGAVWDIPRARVLIATQNTDNAPEFWLVRLGWDANT